MPDGTNCSHPLNLGRYIEEFSCTGDSNNRILKEMRLSFPSGHSSFSAYTMIYCAVSTDRMHHGPWSMVHASTSLRRIENNFLNQIDFRFYRFICKHVWHGGDQDCSNIFCNTFWSWWLGSHVWVASPTTNIIGPMSWLVPYWEWRLRYWWRISSLIWVVGVKRRIIWDRRDTNWEHMGRTTVQSMLKLVDSFAMSQPSST